MQCCVEILNATVSYECKAFISGWYLTRSVRGANNLDLAGYQNGLHHDTNTSYVIFSSLIFVLEEPCTFSYSIATVIFSYNPIKSRLSLDRYFITSIFPVLFSCSYLQKCAQTF